MPRGGRGLSQQVSAKDVSALCRAKNRFVARRRMGGERLSVDEGGRLQGDCVCVAVAVYSHLVLQAT